MNGDPALSVVLCTFNRARLLEGALAALVQQTAGSPRYEIIVVDNNSGDETRETVARFGAAGNVSYHFEPRQGLSAARNRGIRVARAPAIAFTDDDVRVESMWVRRIIRAFDEHPEADWVGGRVEPTWQTPPPNWLKDAGLAPLALVDYGAEPFAVTQARPVCLVGANLAVRRSAFDLVGLFSAAVQRVKDGVGSTEDHELQIRMRRAGMIGWYDPAITVRAEVPGLRLSKQYHRLWHEGHGRFYALMRDPAFEDSRIGALFGVPAHVYRSVACELASYVSLVVRLRLTAAFAHELRLRFLAAYVRQRVLERC